jgi:oligogalacturonide lyase
MSAGQTFPSESISTRDATTGVRLRQITAHPSIHHQPFYYLPAYGRDDFQLFLISHRTGRPEVFTELWQDDAPAGLLQLTDHAGLNEWSIHPSWDGRFVYFTDRIGGCRVSTDTLKVERLVQFEHPDLTRHGSDSVGTAMGTTALSRDGNWWCVPLRSDKAARMIIVDTRNGTARVILEAPQIGHPEFHPHDSFRLRYAGPHTARIWTINRDGTNHRHVFERNSSARQWIVHEVWNPRPGADEILTADWPHGVLGIDVQSGNLRRVTGFNAWHPMISRDGRWMIADTNFPDIGLQLFDPQANEGPVATLAFPQASSRGAHWSVGHCPYDDGPVAVDAPQHTHPHPSFSPSNRRVVFTSDRTGFSQVYEAELTEQFIARHFPESQAV